MNSITYLWLANLIIWAVFFAYLGFLNHRRRKLASRLAALTKKAGVDLDVNK